MGIVDFGMVESFKPRRDFGFYFRDNCCHGVEHVNPFGMERCRITKLNVILNPSVPDSIICVGSRLSQIGAFWPLTSDCTRLRHRRMSWMVPESRAAVFLS